MIRTRVFRMLSLLVAVPAWGALSSAAPAWAVDAATVAGFGTIVPGLSCTNCAIDVNFSAVDAGTAGTGVYAGCKFDGTSNGLETVIGGGGSGTLSGCGITGYVNYTRVGVVVTVSGAVCINSTCGSLGSNALLFIPTSAAPTTSFIVTGQVTINT
jgi:hypothetical protein